MQAYVNKPADDIYRITATVPAQEHKPISAMVVFPVSPSALTTRQIKANGAARTERAAPIWASMQGQVLEDETTFRLSPLASNNRPSRYSTKPQDIEKGKPKSTA